MFTTFADFIGNVPLRFAEHYVNDISNFFLAPSLYSFIYNIMMLIYLQSLPSYYHISACYSNEVHKKDYYM